MIRAIQKIMIVIGAILVCFVVWIIYTWALERYYRTNVTSMILKDSSVSDVEILFNENEDAVMNDFEFEILVSFYDGCTLEIGRVNEHGKGIIIIRYVDNYFIAIGNKDGYSVTRLEEVKVWSTIIETQIESVMDIVKNHHVINQYVKLIPDIHEHRSQNEIERLAIEGPIVEREINGNVVDRLLAEGALRFITVGNEEYCFYKWNTK